MKALNNDALTEVFTLYRGKPFFKKVSLNNKYKVSERVPLLKCTALLLFHSPE